MKEKKILNPEIEDISPQENNNNIPIIEEDNSIKALLSEMNQNNLVVPTNENQSSDSYFRAVFKEFLNIENISAKTEYLNVNEVFVGAKLEFLADFGGMPYMKPFINKFEIKRVSLERKGRKELIMALQERRQEIEAERAKMLSQFNQNFMQQ